MGMSIDEATLYMELYKRKLFNSVSDLDKDIKAYNIAISTIRKYQRIQEIYERFQKDGGYYHHMAWLDVMEVVKNGNVD